MAQYSSSDVANSVFRELKLVIDNSIARIISTITCSTASSVNEGCIVVKSNKKIPFYSDRELTCENRRLLQLISISLTMYEI